MSCGCPDRNTKKSKSAGCSQKNKMEDAAMITKVMHIVTARPNFPIDFGNDLINVVSCTASRTLFLLPFSAKFYLHPRFCLYGSYNAPLQIYLLVVQIVQQTKERTQTLNSRQFSYINSVVYTRGIVCTVLANTMTVVRNTLKQPSQTDGNSARDR